MKMKEILKYQLLNRIKGKRNCIGSIGIMLAANIISITMLGFKLSRFGSLMGTGYNFWLVIALVCDIAIPAIHFFSGIISESAGLMNSGTAYLYQTVPRHGREILGGRKLAALIEFVVALALSLLLMIANAILLIYVIHGVGFSPISSHYYVEQTVFSNIPTILKGTLMLMLFFVTAGSIFSFFLILIHVLVKKTGWAYIISFVVTTIILGKLSNLGDFLASRFNLNAGLEFTINGVNLLAPGITFLFNSGRSVTSDSCPVITMILYLVVSAGLFAGTSWFIEHKLEA